MWQGPSNGTPAFCHTLAGVWTSAAAGANWLWWMTTTPCRSTACRPRHCCLKMPMPTALPGILSLRTCSASQAVASCLPRPQTFHCTSKRCRYDHLHLLAQQSDQRCPLRQHTFHCSCCGNEASLHPQALHHAENCTHHICCPKCFTCFSLAFADLRDTNSCILHGCACRVLLLASRAPKYSAYIITACRPWKCRSLLPCKAI